MTPKGSSFFRTVMVTSVRLPRRLGEVMWLLSTTEKVSSSCKHTRVQTYLQQWKEHNIGWCKEINKLKSCVFCCVCSYLWDTIRPCQKCHRQLSLPWFEFQDACSSNEIRFSRRDDRILHQLCQQQPLGPDHTQVYSVPLLSERVVCRI